MSEISTVETSRSMSGGSGGYVPIMWTISGIVAMFSTVITSTYSRGESFFAVKKVSSSIVVGVVDVTEKMWNFVEDKRLSEHM